MLTNNQNSIRKAVFPVAGLGTRLLLDERKFYQSLVIDDLASFKTKADLIITNRKTDELADVGHKVFTRDLFGTD